MPGKGAAWSGESAIGLNATGTVERGWDRRNTCVSEMRAAELKAAAEQGLIAKEAGLPPLPKKMTVEVNKTVDIFYDTQVVL